MHGGAARAGADNALKGAHVTTTPPSMASQSHLPSYPRIVGETGGKDFVVAHPECDERGLLVALLRGAFEYQKAIDLNSAG